MEAEREANGPADDRKRLCLIHTRAPVGRDAAPTTQQPAGPRVACWIGRTFRRRPPSSRMTETLLLSPHFAASAGGVCSGERGAALAYTAIDVSIPPDGRREPDYTSAAAPSAAAATPSNPKVPSSDSSLPR